MRRWGRRIGRGGAVGGGCIKAGNRESGIGYPSRHSGESRNPF